MNQISYRRHQSGNFIVSLIGTTQEIALLPLPFSRKTGASLSATFGCMAVTPSQAAALGFIIDEGVIARGNDTYTAV
ncbi:hypothetical protein [Marinicrinis sediminis]|uniref:Uncharacterized protein n=1 Tax=Marinicrinis sediminis TaxID=1652465 RepID=A0ABW5RCU5_9BACL